MTPQRPLFIILILFTFLWGIVGMAATGLSREADEARGILILSGAMLLLAGTGLEIASGRGILWENRARRTTKVVLKGRRWRPLGIVFCVLGGVGFLITGFLWIRVLLGCVDWSTELRPETVSMLWWLAVGAALALAAVLWRRLRPHAEPHKRAWTKENHAEGEDPPAPQ